MIELLMIELTIGVFSDRNYMCNYDFPRHMISNPWSHKSRVTLPGNATVPFWMNQ